MAKASIFARSGRKTGDGLPVYLRITHKGERARLSLDMRVREAHWNEKKKRVRSTHPQSEVLNGYLSDIQASADGAIARCKSRGVIPRPDRVKQMVDEELSGDTQTDLLAFFEERLEGYRRRGQEGTYQNYRTVLAKLKKFWESKQGGTLRPKDLTVSLIEDWREWLADTKGNNQTTRAKALSVLRTFYRKARKEGVLSKDEYIFDDITISRGKSEKELPSPGELQKMINLWDEWQGKLSSLPGTNRWRTLAYFLAAYYMGGMRFQDVAHLKWNHLNGWPGPTAKVRYKMGKTEDVTALPIVPKLREILEVFDNRRQDGKEHIFPIFDGHDISAPKEEFRSRRTENARANKYLGKICDQLEITRVSFHVARNLSAWKYYQSTGDIYQVQQMMGHESVDQTRDYLKGFGADIDDSFRDAFG